MPSRRDRLRSTCVSSCATDCVPPAPGVEGRAHLVLRRERGGREPLPDATVLLARQQHHDGRVHATARAPDLLVVRDGRARRPEVDDERQVRLVEAHPERGRRDERLDAVLLEVLLEPLALGGVRLARVRRDRQTGGAELARDLLGGGDGEAVHDPEPSTSCSASTSHATRVGWSGRRRTARCSDSRSGRRAGPGRPRGLPRPRRRRRSRPRRAPPSRRAVPRRRRSRARSPSRSSRAPGCRAAGRRGGCGCAGSPDGSRGPSPRCSAPRR